MISLVLNVKDAAASAAFYAEKLGFKLEGDSLPGPDGKIVFSAAIFDGTMIMFDSRIASPSEPRGVGLLINISLPETGDIDGLYNRLVGEGVTVVEPIEDKFWGQRMFVIKDPDGFALAITKNIFVPTFDDMASVTRGEKPEKT